MSDITAAALGLLVIGFVLLLASIILRHHTQNTRRLARLEAKLDQMLAHSGVEPTENLHRVHELLAADEITAAVKEYRRATDADLLTATRAIEELRGGPSPDPDPDSSNPR